jgi:hypothetical protein
MLGWAGRSRFFRQVPNRTTVGAYNRKVGPSSRFVYLFLGTAPKEPKRSRTVYFADVYLFDVDVSGGYIRLFPMVYIFFPRHYQNHFAHIQPRKLKNRRPTSKQRPRPRTQTLPAVTMGLIRAAKRMIRRVIPRRRVRTTRAHSARAPGTSPNVNINVGSGHRRHHVL